jgi:hypothetical protein
VKKTFFCVLCFFCLISLTFAQFSLENLSFKNLTLEKLDLGGNLGTNMNSRKGWAIAFGLHGDYEIMDNLKVGLQLGMSHDFTEIFVFEPSIYGKYYFPNFAFFGFTPFAQLDLGASVIAAEKTYGRFLTGITAGLRYEFGNLYIEPKLAWGYPFMISVNAALGYSF